MLSALLVLALAAEPANWQSYSDTQNTYKVELPVVPEFKIEPTAIQGLTRRFALATLPGGTFACGVIDCPQGAKVDLDYLGEMTVRQLFAAPGDREYVGPAPGPGPRPQPTIDLRRATPMVNGYASFEVTGTFSWAAGGEKHVGSFAYRCHRIGDRIFEYTLTGPLDSETRNRMISSFVPVEQRLFK